MGEPGTRTRVRSRLKRLAAPAVIGAVAGAAIAANWRERVFSLIFAEARINAGIVMLCCIATGFILGWAFLWSASDRDSSP